MECLFTQEGTCLTIDVVGRIDGSNAPKLEAQCKDIGTDIETLIINLKEVRFVASAGLRVILKLQKKMNKQGSMEVHNASTSLMDVFELTGFANILTFVND